MAANDFSFQSPANREALARARGSLKEHRRVFRALERHALQASDPLVFAGRAQWAIDAAINAHPGLLVSTSLEARLCELGRSHIGSGPATRSGSRGVERVLHVLTEAYEHGGHTRVAERWMLADRDRASNVLLTGQGSIPVPPTLQAAARASGGAVLALPVGDLFARAWNLRALAAAHDLVVLHVHMHDVVPMLALAEPDGRPPTIFFNHAGYRTWLGIGVSDVIANLNEADVRHSYERRGAAPGSAALLPIPAEGRRPDRVQARAELGLDPAVQLVLVMGSPWKVAPILEPAYTELVRALLRASPHAQCLAVGPPSEGAWQVLEHDTGGRARALGHLPSPVAGQLLAAADVVLDTWPVTGGTTIIDAGFAGVPMVSPGDGRPELQMIRPCAGDNDNGGAVLHAPTVSEVAATVAELLADEPERTRLGEIGRAYVDGRHGTGWDATMQSVVELARERAGSATPPATDPPAAETDWECVIELTHEVAGDTLSQPEVLARRAADLPPEERPVHALDAAARLEAILAECAEDSRRAVAAPPIEPEAIRRLLQEVRALVDAGEISSCAVAVAQPDLAHAVSLFERALAADEDLEIELIEATGVQAIARLGDRLLTG